MSENIQLLKRALRQHGYSVTKVREVVFAALDNEEPQTMTQLIQRVIPTIDRASAYRTITLFEELGIVQRLKIGWKYKLELSDEFHAHHHHISCIKCGSIVSFHEPGNVESTIADIASSQGFQLITHQLELQGICEVCQKKHETPTVLAGSNGSLTLPNN